VYGFNRILPTGKEVVRCLCAFSCRFNEWRRYHDHRALVVVEFNESATDAGCVPWRGARARWSPRNWVSRSTRWPPAKSRIVKRLGVVIQQQIIEG
jgi:hypothetical protein